MTAALLATACRLTLAAVLIAAAVGKARALDRFAATLAALAPPPLSSSRWRRAAAGAIAAAELLIALALLAGGSAARYGAAAALALLLGFTAVLLVALARRQGVSCNCFGGGERPISGWDVLRNLFLMAAAATPLLVGIPDGSPDEALAGREGLLALGAAALGLLASTNPRRLAGLWRSASALPAAAALGPPLGIPLGVPLGQAVPTFEGRARASDRRVTAAELAGQAAVLLFLSSGCPKCHQTLPGLLQLLPAIRAAGVTLWILPADPTRDLASLLEGSALLEHALLVEPAVRDQLNPRRVAPAYLFFDHHSVALASGVIGDDDWQSFADQLTAPE